MRSSNSSFTRELLQGLRGRLVQRADVVGVALDLGILYSLVCVGGVFESLEAVANLADVLCELAEVFLSAFRELLQALRGRLAQRVDRLLRQCSPFPVCSLAGTGLFLQRSVDKDISILTCLCF